MEQMGLFEAMLSPRVDWPVRGYGGIVHNLALRLYLFYRRCQRRISISCDLVGKIFNGITPNTTFNSYDISIVFHSKKHRPAFRISKSTQGFYRLIVLGKPSL